ncbi:GCD complex subunit gcd7 [Nowakowskiella sp. JEL0078]|nr:GCD complex subunit gcd7 [Nowakowskiella sp. JEL0078]
MATPVENFKSRLQRRHVSGSYAVSLETLLLLRNIISTLRWQGVEKLALGNMVGRVLHLIRLEEDELEAEGFNHTISPSATSVGVILPPNHRNGSTMLKLIEDKSRDSPSAVIQAIKEVLDEVESVDANIIGQTLDHIYNQ